MTTLQDDVPDLRPVDEWNLPLSPEGFRAWLRAAGLTLDEFLELPAAEHMPSALREDLTRGA